MLPIVAALLSMFADFVDLCWLLGDCSRFCGFVGDVLGVFVDLLWFCLGLFVDCLGICW